MRIQGPCPPEGGISESGCRSSAWTQSDPRSYRLDPNQEEAEKGGATDGGGCPWQTLEPCLKVLSGQGVGLQVDKKWLYAWKAIKVFSEVGVSRESLRRTEASVDATQGSMGLGWGDRRELVTGQVTPRQTHGPTVPSTVLLSRGPSRPSRVAGPVRSLAHRLSLRPRSQRTWWGGDRSPAGHQVLLWWAGKS